MDLEKETFRLALIYVLCCSFILLYVCILVFAYRRCRRSQENRNLWQKAKDQAHRTARKYEIPEIDSTALHLEGALVLGQGSYGIVLEAKLLEDARRPVGTRPVGSPDGRKVAIKQPIGSTPASLQHQLKEFEHHSMLNTHPHIVRLENMEYSFEGFCLHRPFGPMLVFEFLGGGNLARLLKRSREKEASWAEAMRRQRSSVSFEADNDHLFSYVNAARILRQLAGAVVFIHSRKVLHLDIADRNVLLTDLELGKADAKLADFGLTEEGHYFHARSKADRLPRECQTPEYRDEGVICQHTDVWAFGHLAWKLLSVGLSSPSVPATAAAPSGTPPEIASILASCWTEAHDARPSMRTVESALLALGLQEEWGLVYPFGLSSPQRRARSAETALSRPYRTFRLSRIPLSSSPEGSSACPGPSRPLGFGPCLHHSDSTTATPRSSRRPGATSARPDKPATLAVEHLDGDSADRPAASPPLPVSAEVTTPLVEKSPRFHMDKATDNGPPVPSISQAVWQPNVSNVIRMVVGDETRTQTSDSVNSTAAVMVDETIL